jgi:hypothetical protein
MKKQGGHIIIEGSDIIHKGKKREVKSTPRKWIIMGLEFHVRRVYLVKTGLNSKNSKQCS